MDIINTIKGLNQIGFFGLVGALLLSLTANATEPFMIISDIDDTVRITDVAHPADAFWRGTVRHDVFAGMSELYSCINITNRNNGLAADKPVIFVSGSPPVLHNAIQNMLVHKNFPQPMDLSLRKVGAYPGIYEYKTALLEKMVKNHQEPFLLVGDNTQRDPQVYLDFQQRHPDRVVAIYIHNVLNREIPEGVISYLTAFDIAIEEVNQNRLSVDQAAVVGNTVYLSILHHPEFVIPDYAHCPDNIFFMHNSVPRQLIGLNDRIGEALTYYCNHRHDH